MNVLLNGERQTFAAEITVGKLLAQLHLNPEAVVVEVNQQILEKDAQADFRLSDGDQIEIIRFVGGG